MKNGQVAYHPQKVRRFSMLCLIVVYASEITILEQLSHDEFLLFYVYVLFLVLVDVST